MLVLQSNLVRPYTVAVFEGEQAFANLKNVWNDLWSSSLEATETQTWYWQYNYWKHIEPKSRPIIIVAQDCDGQSVALATFTICRDKASLVSKACFLGDKRSDYHLIIGAPNLSESVGRQILERFLTEFGNRVPFVEISGVPENSYTGAVVDELFSIEKRVDAKIRRWKNVTFSVPLPRNIEEYQNSLGARSKRDFRYDRRRLFKEFSAEFRVYGDPGALNEALDAIETIDRARWGSNSRYCLASQRAFEREVARAFCDLGIYRAFILYLNGKPSSFVAGTLVRNAMKVASIGHDPSVSGKFSVGKVTNFLAIEHCIQEGYSEYDLTNGGEEYKKWLGANRSTNLHVRLYRSRLDHLVESRAKEIVSFLRRQDWLRRFYQAVLRQ